MASLCGQAARHSLARCPVTAAWFYHGPMVGWMAHGHPAATASIRRTTTPLITIKSRCIRVLGSSPQDSLMALESLCHIGSLLLPYTSWVPFPGDHAGP